MDRHQGGGPKSVLRSSDVDRRSTPLNLILSRHAAARLQQRGIDRSAVILAFCHGRAFHAGNGTIAYHLGRRVLDQAGPKRAELAPHRDVAVIVSSDGVVVTVEHTPRIPRHWRPAGSRRPLGEAGHPSLSRRPRTGNGGSR